jgi:broad specificity phosphatase PhoE
VQTAEIVGRRFGLTPQVVGGLREYNVGILEGKTYSKEREDLYWRVVLQWMEQDNHAAWIEGGESYNDIAARFMPLIADLEADYRDTDANVLLISHGGTLRAMLPLLLSNVDKAFVMARPFGYANPVVAELREGKWVCLSWGKETL